MLRPKFSCALSSVTLKHGPQSRSVECKTHPCLIDDYAKLRKKVTKAKDPLIESGYSPSPETLSSDERAMYVAILKHFAYFANDNIVNNTDKFTKKKITRWCEAERKRHELFPFEIYDTHRWRFWMTPDKNHFLSAIANFF